MNIQQITQDVLSIAGTFNVWLIISLFFLCFINEFGLSIPYLMESVWILVGYNTLSGIIPVYQLFIIWITAVTGRMVGATCLYKLLGLGSTWIMKIYHKFFGSFLKEPKANDNSLPQRIMRRINLFSPFSVALGRLMWLKIPLTLLLSMRKQLKTLLTAISLSSAIWDGTYIIVGVIGGNTRLSPAWFILYSIGALTVIYGLIFLIRRIFKLDKPVPVK
jgi:membrane-associated protein